MKRSDVNSSWRIDVNSSWRISTFFALLNGFIFGVSIDKAQVLVTPTARLPPKYGVAQFFMGAIASSQVVFAIFSMFKVSHRRFLQSRAHIDSVPGMTAALLGGALMGFGYHLSGMTPSTFAVELGRGVERAIYPLIGCLVAISLSSLYSLRFNGLLDSKLKRRKGTIESSLTLPQYHMTAVPFAASLIVGSLVLEMFYPTSMKDYESAPSFMTMSRWPPIACGMFVGLLQIPCVFILGQSLQVENAYMTLVAQVCRFNPEKSPPYFRKWYKGVANWWQVLFLIGSACGARASTAAAGRVGDASFRAARIAPGTLILSGFLMSMGAQISGSGGVLGHGVSGVAHLLPSSILVIGTAAAVSNILAVM